MAWRPNHRHFHFREVDGIGIVVIHMEADIDVSGTSQVVTNVAIYLEKHGSFADKRRSELIEYYDPCKLAEVIC